VAKNTRRITVTLPAELAEALDQLMGQRERRQFLVDALSEKLARLRLAQAAEQAAGSLADVDIPGWETSEQASEWVHNLRRAGPERPRRAERRRSRSISWIPMS